MCACDGHMTYPDAPLGAYGNVLGASGRAETTLIVHVQQVTLSVDHTHKQDSLVLLLVEVVLCIHVHVCAITTIILHLYICVLYNAIKNNYNN